MSVTEEGGMTMHTDGEDEMEVEHVNPEHVNPARIMSKARLLQRPLFEYAEHRVTPLISAANARRCDTQSTFQLHQMQEAYDEYCRAVRQEYSNEFWRVLSTVYLEQTVVIDRVLKTCRSVFVLNKGMKARFDPSVRALRARSLAKAGDFPSLVMHSITIDMREFRLPGIKEVEFRFVNSLWAWVAAANDMLDAGQCFDMITHI